MSYWWAQSMSCLKCFPISSANLSKGITWCLPGSTQCLSSSICLMGWSVSIWAGSQLCLSANVLLWESCWCLPGLSSASACQCLSSELNQCLARSVSQCLLPIYLKGSLDVFQDQPNVFLPSIFLIGSDQCLSELALICLYLLMSIMRNLLMSLRTELACLLADVFLVSSINVSPEVFPNVFCQSV